MSHFTRILLRRKLLMAAIIMGLGGCVLDNSSIKKNPIIPEKGFVFTVNSDYKTGSFSAYGIDSALTVKDIEPIHSDSAVRYAGGNDILILNRLGRDNLQVVDRHSLKTVMQVAFPANSNPYDIALKDSLFYVALLGSKKIGIYRQSDGKAQGEIDLSAYADTADGLPETTDLIFIDGTLYALLANLDTKKDFAPQQARLVKIDVATKSVTKSLDLPYGNPLSMAYDPESNKLYIPCRGTFFDETFALLLDGGIIGVSLSKFAVAETLATEVGLSGGLNSAIYNDGRLIMDLTEAAVTGGESILSISLNSGKAVELAKVEQYQVGGIAVDSTSNSLFIGDRKQGLRIFDLKTGKEKDPSQVSLGNLPITDLAVVR